jgi:DNA topoisomerase-1
MAYILVIVESPAKCKKIEQYLNTQPQATKPYKCLASYGHIRELAGLAAIDIHNNFAPTFIECVSKKDHLSKLKKAIKDASEVILASDDDREGEAIAWHLAQVFHLPVEKTSRIVFHEITETALHAAIAKPIRINMPLVQAQMARQILDILVGYKLSPLLWKHVKDGLSAGRCQTPALRLIYDNEREILAAPGKQSYTVTGYFTNANIPFILKHAEEDPAALEKFLQASLSHPHNYKGVKLQSKTRTPPEPFTTSALQQCSSNELHLSPKETMSLCQSLYEGGYITYHRTDSKTYSEEFQTKALAYIVKTYGENYAQKQAQAQVQSGQALIKGDLAGVGACPNGGEAGGAFTKGGVGASPQAHEAIRITDLACLGIEDSVTNKRENRLYQLIRQRTFESCMTEATVSVLTATITAPHQHEYHYTTEQIIFPGWKIVNEKKGADEIASAAAPDEIATDSTGKHYAYLQTLKSNIDIPYQKIKANVHLKELKTHYTEARLVHLLEEKGIGRPSTFASLIEKIQERNYVKKTNVKGKLLKCTDYEIVQQQIIKITTEKEFGNEKNKLVMTPTGILALEFLLQHFEPLFQYAYTKQMEEDLDAVANGTKIWHEVCQTCYSELENLSATIEEKGKETIRIDAEHTYMIGKYGPVIKCTGTVGAVGASTDGNAAKGKRKASEITFKTVRTDLDLNKLRRGEYTLEEVLEPANKEPSSIGMYMDKPVFIKVGKFGKYLEWNKLTKSLKHLKQSPTEITMDDVCELLFDLDTEVTATLRIINEDASICKGKYGAYIFYKNKKMKKPRFLKLDGFTGDYVNCELNVLQDWFKTTYKIET